jgi:hypothetical protein
VIIQENRSPRDGKSDVIGDVPSLESATPRKNEQIRVVDVGNDENWSPSGWIIGCDSGCAKPWGARHFAKNKQIRVPGLINEEN